MLGYATCGVLDKTQLDGLLKEIEKTLVECNNEPDGFDQFLAAEIIEATIRQYQFETGLVPGVQEEEVPVQMTFNLCGVYNSKGESVPHKVRIQFASQKAADEYELDLLIGACTSWLGRNYPCERIQIEEFDLDCEGQHECADNDDVILAL